MSTYALLWCFYKNPDDTQNFEKVRQEIPVDSMLPLPAKGEQVTYNDEIYDVMDVLRGVILDSEANVYKTAFRINAVHSENLKAAIKNKSSEVARKIRDHY